MTTLDTPRPPRPTSRHGFGIAILCANALEADAVDAVFDFHWDDDGPPFDKEFGDPNAYSTGIIGRHNVVLAHMPAIGKANAAIVASNCQKSFPNINLALVVGTCGVVPFGPNGEEIVLGDVIISKGIIQYDFGRQLPGHFVRKDTLLDNLGRPPFEIRSIMAKLESLRGRQNLNAKMVEYLNILQLEPLLSARYPGKEYDNLFEAKYCHIGNGTCGQVGCNGSLIQRHRLQTDQHDTHPTVHFGLVASGDSILRSGEDRDKIAEKEGAIAFEMESAGIWDIFPCLVIKGACDYADSHKSKLWQRYAAATAAACAKAFLNYWVPPQPPGM